MGEFRTALDLDPNRIDSLAGILAISRARKDRDHGIEVARAHLPRLTVSALKGKLHELLGLKNNIVYSYIFKDFQRDKLKYEDAYRNALTLFFMSPPFLAIHNDRKDRQQSIRYTSYADIIAYRRQHERLIERVAEARIPTRHGEFTAVSYRSIVDKDEHVALVKGDIHPDEPILVRVHSECLTGDVFGSIRCDCGAQMDLALQAIQREGKGVFLYMRQEGRGIGIHNKLKAYALQDDGLDTVEANLKLGFPPDLRHYGVGAQILVDLGVEKMRLLTNNPKKVVGLESFGLKLVEQVPIIAPVNDENRRYMKTKQERMGHLIDPDYLDTTAADGE